VINTVLTHTHTLHLDTNHILSLATLPSAVSLNPSAPVPTLLYYIQSPQGPTAADLWLPG
jgi:L-ascorbate metabolism protein UlaG (beta-lactamase superfamily)